MAVVKRAKHNERFEITSVLAYVSFHVEWRRTNLPAQCEMFASGEGMKVVDAIGPSRKARIPRAVLTSSSASEANDNTLSIRNGNQNTSALSSIIMKVLARNEALNDEASKWRANYIEAYAMKSITSATDFADAGGDRRK